MELIQWIDADFEAVRSKLFDSVIALIPQDRWHEQVDNGGTTVAGLLLHVARHQDLAVQVAIKGRAPIFATHRSELGLAQAHDGVGLTEAEDQQATALMPSVALVQYIDAVFDATQDWLRQLSTSALDHTPDTSDHLDGQANISVNEFPWLHRMWGNRPTWWLVQWPVIGHANAHIGEGISIRNRMGLSPF